MRLGSCAGDGQEYSKAVKNRTASYAIFSDDVFAAAATEEAVTLLSPSRIIH